MTTHCETNVLEARLLSLRDAPSRGHKSASLLAVKNSSKTEVRRAWEKVRAIASEPGWELDCLQRVAVLPPSQPIECKRAIVLVLGPGYEQMCEWLLETLVSFGDSPEAQIVLFCIDGAYERMSSVARWVPNVTRVRCRSVEKITPAVKGVVYSLARWVKAEAVIALECDMLVTDSLQPLWSTIEQSPTAALMGCAPGGSPRRWRISREASRAGTSASDLEWITDIPNYDTEVWFNGGLLAGQHNAWLELDQIICSWIPFCSLWIEGFAKPYGDEMVMNMAVGRMAQQVTLPAGWNVQSFTSQRHTWFRTKRTPHSVCYAHPKGRAAHILHFAAGARPLMREVFYELALNAIAKRKCKSEAMLTT